jgi:hypothetical protein
MIWFLLPLILFIIVFSCPFGVEVEGRNDSLTVKLILAGIRYTPKLKPKEKQKEKKAEKKKEQSGESILSILRSLTRGTESVWREFGLDDATRVWKIFKLMKRGFHLRIRRFDLCIATPDPAMTGILYGSACAIRSVIPPRHAVNVSVSFIESTPSVDYRIVFSFIPTMLLVRSIRALMFVPFRKVARVTRKVKSQLRAKEVVQHA